MSLKTQGKPQRCAKEELSESSLDHSQVVHLKAHVKAALSSGIEEAERQFALCNFQHALTQANHILEDQMLVEERALGDAFISQHSPIYELPLSNPLQEYNTGESKRDNSQIDDTHFMVRVVINLQDNQYSSTRERAACIAIQTSYELWKVRSPDVMDEKLCLDLSPFFKIYDGSGTSISATGDIPGFAALMTLDLAALYIHFCHAIGLQESSIVSSLRIFSVLVNIEAKIRLRDDDDDGSCEDSYCSNENKNECDNDDRLYKYCSDILDMIVVQTIPFITDIRIVESITDAIFTIVRNGSDTSQQLYNTTTGLWGVLKINSSIEPLSLKVAIRNLEAILACEEGKMSSCVREALQDTLIDAMELDVTSTDATCEGSKDIIRSNIESVVNRLEDIEKSERGSTDGIEGNHSSFAEDILEHFWKSEERWINRGKLVSAGIITYCVWKRRRRVFGRTKSALNLLLSPAREIVNALHSPLK